MTNRKLFLDMNPASEESMMGWNASDRSPDYAVVLPAPTPTRNLTRGNLPVGIQSVEFLNKAWEQFRPDEPLPSFYWTFLSPDSVKFKKKPPIKKIRDHMPKLIKELRLMLTGSVQQTVSAGKSRAVVSCVYCDSANEMLAPTCIRCGAPLGLILPYYTFNDESLVEVTRKRRILVQGTETATHLCPSFTNMTADHGALFYNPDLDAIVVPTYEFWQMMYDKTKQALVMRDLERFFTLPDPVAPEHILTNHFDDVDYSQPLVLDIETTSLTPEDGEIIMIGYKTLDGEKPVTIVEGFTQNDLVRFLLDLEKNQTQVICHNTQFDIHYMYGKSGLHEVKLPLQDTMLMAFVRGETPMNLKHLASKYTDRPGPHAFGGIEDYGYLAEDVLSTEALYHHFGQYGTSFALDLLHNILPFMVEMRLFGVYIDKDLFEGLAPWFEENIEKSLQPLQARMKAQGLEDINFNSSQQVVDFLRQEGVTLVEKTASGAFSVSEPVLQVMKSNYPVVEELLEYRFHSKQSTFMDSYRKFLQHDGKLHPRMKLHGTETGRLSCTDPNLQQVPRVGPIKTMFTSRWENGKIGLIDLAQAELRVLALLANDERFAEALTATDVHKTIASLILGLPEDAVTTSQRKASKAITFGIIYGGSDRGLAGRAGLPVQQVTQVRQQFLNTFSNINHYIESTKRNALSSGWVTSPLGRHRDIGRILLLEDEHGAGRKAINTPIQGTASDIMLYVNWKGSTIFRTLEMLTRFIFGVHDSNLLDIHGDEIQKCAYSLQQAFLGLSDTPLADFPLWSYLPIPGELVIASSWAHTESTNEAYDPESVEIYPCSTHLTGHEIDLHPQTQTQSATW